MDYTWSAPSSFHLDKAELTKMYADHAVLERSPETSDEIERIVTRVMVDMVNYCTYEMGDDSGTITPSVPKSQRQLIDDFEAASLTPRVICPAVQSASSPVADSALEMTSSSAITGDQVEHEVWQTVRHLVRQVMLTERDTLRRKANKIKKS